jgi:putative PIG3 family NAD(P)H quinone oxidoreductase
MAEEAMRVVKITRPGGPEVLALAEAPLPEPGPGELRVRVAASGVNRADLLQRRGHYPAPPGWPADIPGLEYGGVVDAIGEGTRLFGAGDVVMGIVGGGGYAERVVIHEREAVRAPRGMDAAEAGAIPEAFMTAYDALFAQMRLSAGETVLVHAAGSGVGTAAIQLARAAGATVLGTSRTVAKLERAGELGLHVGIVADGGEEWPKAVREATGGRGVDVILDLVGGPYVAGNLRALAECGRWIVVGVTGGVTAPFDLRALMTRRASVTGTVLRGRPPEQKMALAREFEACVVPLFERGALRPVVTGVYPPERATEAHEAIEANRSFGKLLLRWEG